MKMAKHCCYVLRVVCVLGVLLVFPVQIQAQVIFWPGKVVVPAGASMNPQYEALLGAPDGNIIAVQLAQGKLPFVEIGFFTRGMLYRNLVTLLGVPPSLLARANVIGFEYNGGHAAAAGGWESSAWVFSDGTHSATVTYNEITGQASPSTVTLIASKSINGADYRAFFGISSSVKVDPVISFILFHVPPPIDVTSPAFTVSLSGLGTGIPAAPYGEGTPDPDAIGVLACPLVCPVVR